MLEQSGKFIIKAFFGFSEYSILINNKMFVPMVIFLQKAYKYSAQFHSRVVFVCTGASGHSCETLAARFTAVSTVAEM